MIVKSTIQNVVDCTHCGLPVPKGLVVEARDEQFCCSGCETAWELIHGNGLDAFYRMASPVALQTGLADASIADQSFSGFDEDVFRQKYVSLTSGGLAKVELALEGIHCAACIWLIEKLPGILPGVVQATVHWSRRTVTVQWHEEAVALSGIASVLNRLGYRPTPLRENSKRKRWQLENRKHLIRIGVAAACAGNNMIISAALYLGMFSHMTVGMSQMLRVASGVVGLVSLLWPGRTFLNSALASIRTRTPHMDLPIALALSVGTVAGVFNVIRGNGEIYFDSLAVLVFLLLIGRWFQFRQQAKATDAVELMQQLTPQTTKKIVDGEPVEVLVELVQKEDQLLVGCGDLFPVDGTIIRSETEVDEAILTGESLPVSKILGDTVYAGSTNVGSNVVIQATEVGHETRLGSIVDLVEEASATRPQIVQWANRVGGYFVVTIILLAATTFLWWFSTDPAIAVDRCTALLIVACPCALALATPLTLAVALGRAAKEKIVVKSGVVLQALKHPGVIWLDKTGTVTDGNLTVANWYGNTKSLSLVAVLESHSSHPVARAILRYCEQRLEVEMDSRSMLTNLRDVSNVRHHAGRGMSANIDGQEVVVGNRVLLDSFDVEPADRQIRIADLILNRGGSPCWIAVDGKAVAIAELTDSLRPEAKVAISSLRQRGWRIGILSGDHQNVVDRVASQLDIDPNEAIGGATPEDKLAIVERSREIVVPASAGSSQPGSAQTGTTSNATVVMVGDGVNDSAALAAATVGIAVKESAEASLSAAPVYLASPGLQPIIRLLDLSRSTSFTMRLNLAVSIAYNLGFAALAFLGHISPLVAAILMPLSSITVVAISLTAGSGQKGKS